MSPGGDDTRGNSKCITSIDVRTATVTSNTTPPSPPPPKPPAPPPAPAAASTPAVATFSGCLSQNNTLHVALGRARCRRCPRPVAVATAGTSGSVGATLLGLFLPLFSLCSLPPAPSESWWDFYTAMRAMTSSPVWQECVEHRAGQCNLLSPCLLHAHTLCQCFVLCAALSVVAA